MENKDDYNSQKFSISLGHLFLLSNLAIGLLGFIYLQWVEGQSQVKLWVLNRDLPAYTQIKPTDLAEKTVPDRTISPEVVKEVDKLRDRYTIAEVPKDKPISKKQLGPELTADQKKLLQNTVLIGIPATPAMFLGGNLQAGDRVNVMVVQEATKKQPNPQSILFSNTFVFDVKSNSKNSSATNQSLEWVVILAIPANHQEDFTRSISDRKVILSRKF